MRLFDTFAEFITVNIDVFDNQILADMEVKIGSAAGRLLCSVS